MNRHLPFICLCLPAFLVLELLGGCGPPPPHAAKKAAPAEERAELQFDDRKWKPGFQGSRGVSVINEYILANESIENWTELFTAQLLTGLPKRMTAEDFVRESEAKLRNVVTGKLEWNVINTKPNDVLYEWTLVKDHLRRDEQEIVRIIKGTDGMHIIHFTTRNIPMTGAARQKWIGLLNAAKIVK
jgi:hypothetical protein